MKKYYTRVCNFAYGKSSIELVREKKNLPLNGNKRISFGQIEILTRTSVKIINLKDIKKLPKSQREKINKELKIIIKKNNNFSNLNFKKIPNIMGVLLKSKFEKFLFFLTIILRSLLIFSFSNLGNFFISLRSIILIEVRVRISICPNEIFLLPFIGRFLFFLTSSIEDLP